MKPSTAHGVSVAKLQNRRLDTKFPILEATLNPSQQGFQQKLERT